MSLNTRTGLRRESEFRIKTHQLHWLFLFSSPELDDFQRPGPRARDAQAYVCVLKRGVQGVITGVKTDGIFGKVMRKEKENRSSELVIRRLSQAVHHVLTDGAIFFF